MYMHMYIILLDNRQDASRPADQPAELSFPLDIGTGIHT